MSKYTKKQILALERVNDEIYQAYISIDYSIRRIQDDFRGDELVDYAEDKLWELRRQIDAEKHRLDIILEEHIKDAEEAE